MPIERLLAIQRVVLDPKRELLDERARCERKSAEARFSGGTTLGSNGSATPAADSGVYPGFYVVHPGF